MTGDLRSVLASMQSVLRSPLQYFCCDCGVDDNIVFMTESLSGVVRHQPDLVAVIRFSTLA